MHISRLLSFIFILSLLVFRMRIAGSEDGGIGLDDVGVAATTDVIEAAARAYHHFYFTESPTESMRDRMPAGTDPLYLPQSSLGILVVIGVDSPALGADPQVPTYRG
jgi:hypothetical protein